MTTVVPDTQHGKRARRKDRGASPFSTKPLPDRVPHSERLYYFDRDAQTTYWIHTSDVVALRLYRDSLRAELRKVKRDHEWWLGGSDARRYLSSDLARTRLRLMNALETELAGVCALLPVKHAPGSVPKHDPSVYVKLREQGLDNSEISRHLGDVSEAGVRRGLRSVGYKPSAAASEETVE